MRLNPLLLFIVAFHSLIFSDKLKCSPVFTVQPEFLSYGEPTKLAKKSAMSVQQGDLRLFFLNGSL